MSDYQDELPDMDKIPLTKINWTEVTKEGNRICQDINKLIKTVPNEDEFRTEYITSMKELLRKVYEVVNSKLPKLNEYLEMKGLDQFNDPDWARAFLTNDELRYVLKI